MDELNINLQDGNCLVEEMFHAVTAATAIKRGGTIPNSRNSEATKAKYAEQALLQICYQQITVHDTL
jgi:hypothetical protein